MKTTNLIFLFVLGIAIITPKQANAQSSITIEASQMITNFAFQNSEGLQENSYFILNSENEYKPVYSGSYHVGYAYMFDMGLFIKANVGMRKGGATMVYDNNNYRWDLKYGQGRLGFGYALDLGLFAPYLGVYGYYAQLLKANQTINNEDFDIINNGEIESNDYGVYVSPGVQINASDYMSVFLEISYLMGLQNIESSQDEGQEAYNLANAFTLGLSFNIE